MIWKKLTILNENQEDPNKPVTYLREDLQENKFYFSDRIGQNLHRVDGPAIEYANGRCEWYFEGKKLDKDDWEIVVKKPHLINFY